MRLKFIIYTIAVYISVLVIIILAHASNSMQTDTLFGQSRKDLIDNITDATVMPEQIGDFKRQGLQPTVPDRSTGGHATYAYGPTTITLIVSSLAPDNLEQVWTANFLALSCGDIEGKVVAHHETKFPYRFGSCQTANFRYYEFKWINGKWIFTASADNRDRLEQFINSYPY